MNVHVRLSAGLVPVGGNPRLVVTLAENATIADLLEHLLAQHPALASKMGVVIPMVSGRHAALSDPLSGVQEVALLLPAAGGSW
jgi:molybdopterin converting factor small subunit